MTSTPTLAIRLLAAISAATLAACAFGFPSAAAAQQPPALPKLDIVLTPQQHDGNVGAVDVRLRIGNPRLAAGKELLKMATYMVSIDVPAYAPEAIDASDDAGKLTLTTVDGPPDPSMVFRQYRVDRATVGNVTVRYTGKPRHVDATTRNGPLYDLRAEAGGLLGAGMYFLALPADEQTHQVTLDWDLSHAPAGTRGVWSLGEGRQTHEASSMALFTSGFAIGPVKSVPAGGNGPFGLYWLSEPPFDMHRLAADTQTMYDYMARFFKDPGTAYRIFARSNPYPSSGGSGWAGSFVFAYGSAGAELADQQALLAHEMVHNWPRLDGDDLADTTWYTEGIADYYSALLPYRAGLITRERFVELVNEYAQEYQTNPAAGLSNQEAAQRFWQDAHAQKIPYGRGFMYFVRLDAQLAARSHGKRGVDDLVLNVLARQRAGGQVTTADWRALVTAELGDAAGREYDDMVAGKPILPPATAWGSCLKLSQVAVRPLDVGFDEMSMAVVRKLRAGSPAAAAGLADGDRIVSMTNKTAAFKKEDQELMLVVARDGVERKVSYLPRGPAMQVWRWEVPAGAAACKF